MREQKPANCKEVSEDAIVTFKHLRHKNQLLLIPITMYSGFEQAFYNAEWTSVSEPTIGRIAIMRLRSLSSLAAWASGTSASSHFHSV
jgi:hypothetical protein